MNVLAPVIALCAFLAIYEVLRRRSQRRSGVKPPVRWGWLAAIVGLAVIALAVGAIAK